MTPLEQLKSTLLTYLTDGIENYQPTDESTQVVVPSFVEMAGAPMAVYLDEVPALQEDGKKVAAAGPDVVIYTDTEPKPLLPNSDEWWWVTLMVDLTLPPDTVEDRQVLLFKSLHALLQDRLHVDEPEPDIRAPLAVRLDALRGVYGVEVADVKECTPNGVISQVEGNGITRSLRLVVLCALRPV